LHRLYLFICPLTEIRLLLIDHKSRGRKYIAATSVSGLEAKAWMKPMQG
jgi:hypothetical protein